MNADEIRLTVIKAIFSTPQLEAILTLKGGNAMKLQGLTDRGVPSAYEEFVSIRNTPAITVTCLCQFKNAPLFYN